MSNTQCLNHHTFPTAFSTAVQTLPRLSYITRMNWLIRLLMVLVAGAVLLVFLAVAVVLLLLSCLRWLITGRKPDVVIMVNAMQRYKHMTQSMQRRDATADDIIEAEVREVKDQPPHLPR
ncbi:MAG: hypothetical protein RLY60_1265 [Pseudomonadota bacterium]